MPSRNILLVEDEVELRSILKDHIYESTDYKIVEANNGFEGYQKARNQKFDLICTDFRMPRVTGNELIAALRENQSNALTPILVYTGYIEEAKEKCSEFENIYYLEKPASLTKIVELFTDIMVQMDEKSGAKKSSFKVDVEFLKPFINSTIHTISTMFGIEDVKPQKIGLLTDDLDIDISGVITINSPSFDGIIGLSFKEVTFLEIVSKMVKEEQKTMSKELQDAAAEIINVIFGLAKNQLSKQGFKISKSTLPSVISGKGHNIHGDRKNPVVIVPFETKSGLFYMQICLRAR